MFTSGCGFLARL